jgi:uncharacterized protein (DUF1778 family)
MRFVCALNEHTLTFWAIGAIVLLAEEHVMTRAAAENTSRFPMQSPPTERARLMRAALLERTTLKDFILLSALIAAEAVIEKAERIKLDEKQTRFILDLLDNPPKPNPRLLAAAQSLAALS